MSNSLSAAGFSAIGLGVFDSLRPTDTALTRLIFPAGIHPVYHALRVTPQHRLQAAYISKLHRSDNKRPPPHVTGQSHINIFKEIGLLEKARPPVDVTAFCLSLFRAGQHARNRTGILDQSGDKPAGLRLTSALRKHAKNNAR